VVGNQHLNLPAPSQIREWHVDKPVRNKIASLIELFTGFFQMSKENAKQIILFININRL
jgi:hypothetical protein